MDLKIIFAFLLLSFGTLMAGNVSIELGGHLSSCSTTPAYTNGNSNLYLCQNNFSLVANSSEISIYQTQPYYESIAYWPNNSTQLMNLCHGLVDRIDYESYSSNRYTITCVEQNASGPAYFGVRTTSDGNIARIEWVEYGIFQRLWHFFYGG